MTAGGSDDQRESTDSASFSIPSLELSDGVMAPGNSLDIDDGLSSSYSALGVEGCSPSTEVPSLKEDEALEAAGEVSSGCQTDFISFQSNFSFMDQYNQSTKQQAFRVLCKLY